MTNHWIVVIFDRICHLSKTPIEISSIITPTIISSHSSPHPSALILLNSIKLFGNPVDSNTNEDNWRDRAIRCWRKRRVHQNRTNDFVFMGDSILWFRAVAWMSMLNNSEVTGVNGRLDREGGQHWVMYDGQEKLFELHYLARKRPEDNTTIKETYGMETSENVRI